MNPLLKKEIRLLLPSFGVCCALALLNLAFRFDSNGSLMGWWWFVLAFVFSGAMAVMLALNSFGAEISSGTFSNLLAQPISRQKIWDTKILVLAVSLSIVGIFFSACGIIRLAMIGHDLNLLDLFTGVGIFGLVVFSGGLWTVLLLRQVAAAFWFTVLVPGFLLVILMGLFADHSDEFGDGMVASVLGLYSLAGFFFARWLFFRAQDIQWSGGAIVLPEMRGLPAWASWLAAKKIGHPRAALWRKEIQLHQSQFVLAGALVVLHLGVLATQKLGHFRKNSTTEFILESFWMLWLVMPLLVGCAAVAEERKLGTHESQLCLPVKRRTQFAVKLAVALGLSVALGVFMPLLLEGTKILPDVQFKIGNFDSNLWNGTSTMQILFWNFLGMCNVFWPLLTMAGLAVLIGGISFYASSLARNTLQTLAPALAGIVAALFLILIATIPWQLDIDYLWHGPLPYFIVLPAMVLTLLALAYRNYQSVLTGWNMGRRNLLVLASVLALTVTATSAIYHRVWEKLTPFEPPHGAARLTLANPAKLNAERREAFVRLPDGRIWMALFMPDPRSLNPFSLMLGNFKKNLDDGQFIGGSNWLMVKPFMWDLVGIKTDGSLWVSEKPWRYINQVNGPGEYDNKAGLKHLVPFGTETNWSSLAPLAYSALLTKTDGTLWRWGAVRFDYDRKTNRWPGLRTFTPKQLGIESNWAEVFQGGYRSYLRKTDGTIWTWSDYSTTNGKALLEIEPGFTLVKTFDNQAQARFRSTTETWHGLRYKIGIRDDGTFRIWSHELLTTNSGQRYGSYDWFPTDSQIGADTNWLAVAGGSDKVVTLKSDGTLWLWNFHRHRDWMWNSKQFEAEILKTVPVRLGTHADWIAISGDYDSVTALAADGSLWYWPLENGYLTSGRGFGYFDSWGYDFGNGNSLIPPLLDISRKPQLLGNVFGKPD
ncbi:MAG TPA: ABC transporter permease subunit [Candidatus Limnocylindrales bacterium]|nr:ABC transporter permease subunit [Candidatus Limnocylindrales bacterium]